ncbi:MAG: hypothetical protein ACOC44_17990 [Promethearchaeia archaeon]
MVSHILIVIAKSWGVSAQCKIFSDTDLAQLSEKVNTFLKEEEIGGSNIYETFQTQTKSSGSQPKVVVSIFYTG